MRFACERDDLHAAIAAVSGVVASKGVHPVYESVEIQASEGKLTFLATDLEIGMRVTLCPGESLKVEHPGTAVIPAARLAAIARELPKGPVTFSWDADRRECRLKAGRGVFHLQGQSPEDFPEIPGVGDAQSVNVAAEDLRRLIRRVAFAAAKERMRYAINGLLLNVTGDTLEFVATDGRRLARERCPCENPSGIEIRAIVPTKGLQQLDRSIGPDDTTVALAVGNNHFGGRTARVTVVSRLVEGAFPPHEDVIPSVCEHRAVLEREALAGALKRVALVTTRDAQSVKFAFAEGGLTISARSTEGSAEETVACDYAGSEQILGFNPAFFSDALAVLGEESVAFEWNGKTAPSKLVEGNYTYVLMPISLE